MGINTWPSCWQKTKDQSLTVAARLAFAGTPRKPDKVQEQWTKTKWLSKVTKDGRKIGTASFSLITFCLSGGTIASNLWEMGRKYCLLPASLHLVYIRWLTDPQAGKNPVKLGQHVTFFPVLEGLSHSLACSMPLGGWHTLGSLRLKLNVYF